MTPIKKMLVFCSHKLHVEATTCGQQAIWQEAIDEALRLIEEEKAQRSAATQEIASIRKPSIFSSILNRMSDPEAKNLFGVNKDLEAWMEARMAARLKALTEGAKR